MHDATLPHNEALVFRRQKLQEHGKLGQVRTALRDDDVLDFAQDLGHEAVVIDDNVVLAGEIPLDFLVGRGARVHQLLQVRVRS